MKIAISTVDTTMNADLDSRFGRTRYFIIYNSETLEAQAINNEQNLKSAQGAGIQAAMNVAEAQAEAVITGHCGPKAFRVLKEAGIKVYLTTASTANEAIELYNNNQLTEAQSADVEGHWA